MEQVTILGATGSIGANTLAVLNEHRDRYAVFALTANNQVDELVELAQQFRPRFVVIAQTRLLDVLHEKISAAGINTTVLAGQEALCQVSSDSECKVVVAAIVGAAGLDPTMSAVRAGKRVLLANKESLVMAGQLFVDEVKLNGAKLMPVDSEHNAIFQSLPDNFQSISEAGVKRILLTGSGGPFRTFCQEDLINVTPEQACAHPNWSMGKKISVDSATMMNKGLEFIEACWLFNARSDQIEVVLHPQSIVHSMVEYVDGSVLAQMGSPDMKTPIAHCLAWPERISAPIQPLNFADLSLEFLVPDEQKFPCLALAKQAMRAGRDVPAALNAANEEAVDAFLAGQIRFPMIAQVVDSVLQGWESTELTSIEMIKEIDSKARCLAKASILTLAR